LVLEWKYLLPINLLNLVLMALIVLLKLTIHF
jgi:NADH-quinone oxidoreductase subunit H